MSHGIKDNKAFYSLRQPAWHDLGTVSEDELTVVQAAEIVGLPRIEESPLFTYAGHDLMRVNQKAIIGYPHNKPVVYGTVGKNYEVITHDEFVRLWDNVTHQTPVETLGLLGRGETLFLSYHLPHYDVSGDEIAPYILGVNPLNGHQAVTARITPVRVVCQNTLMMSEKATVRQFVAAHNWREVRNKLTKWVAEAWENATKMCELLREAGELLAHKMVSEDAITDTLTLTYPQPTRPDVDQYSDDGLKALATWETEYKLVLRHHDAVRDLFEGSDTRTRASIGTAWGLFNAVVEYEDFKRGHISQASKVFGASARRKQKCYAHLIEA